MKDSTGKDPLPQGWAFKSQENKVERENVGGFEGVGFTIYNFQKDRI